MAGRGGIEAYLHLLDEAFRGWTEIDAPYEVARARLGPHQAYLASDDVSIQWR